MLCRTARRRMLIVRQLLRNVRS